MSDTCRCGHEYVYHDEFGECEVDGCGCEAFIPDDRQDAGDETDRAYVDNYDEKNDGENYL